MYKLMGELASTHKADRFKILAFPCGQFMHQEFDKASEIEQFAKDTLERTHPGVFSGGRLC